MDDHSSRSGYTCCQGDEEKISYLLDHLPASSSPYSSATCAVGFPSSKAEQMPSSSSYPIASSSGAGGGGDGGGKRFLDQDFDSLDCESEVEGMEVFEEPAKPVAVRISGSKRSRAAEVHNMSEKRRRSRINEKMRALQNLIPNSNKTDKASMLDEAIEYLKQLQLQVQILSMRNGVNLHTMYMSGALEPLQTSQMSIGFGLDGDPAMNIGSMNIGSAALPLSQDLAAQTSLDMSNRCASSHPPTLTTPGLVDVANSQAPLVNSMQSHLGSFQVPVPCESIFTGEMSAAHMQLAAAINYTQNLSENERNSAAAHAKLVGGQTSSGVGLDRLEECMLGKEERGGEMLSNEETFIQHLQGLEDLFQVQMPRNDAIKISESAVNAFALLTNFEAPPLHQQLQLGLLS